MSKFGPEIHRRIGLRFRDLRKKANLTQRDLGEKLGVSGQQIGKYERGESAITVADFEYVQSLPGGAGDGYLPSQSITPYRNLQEASAGEDLVPSLEKLLDDLGRIVVLARKS